MTHIISSSGWSLPHMILRGIVMDKRMHFSKNKNQQFWKRCIQLCKCVIASSFFNIFISAWKKSWFLNSRRVTNLDYPLTSFQHFPISFYHQNAYSIGIPSRSFPLTIKWKSTFITKERTFLSFAGKVQLLCSGVSLAKTLVDIFENKRLCKYYQLGIRYKPDSLYLKTKNTFQLLSYARKVWYG